MQLYMLDMHNNELSSLITGSSNHNEHIERMWRDVHQSVTSIFASTFWALEADDILDCLNELDVFVLHCVFAKNK